MKKLIIILLALFPILSNSQSNKFVRQGLRAEDLNEQIKLFSEAISLDSKNLDAYFYRGVAKNNIGDFNGAILDYTKVIFYEPSPDVYFNRGNSKYSLMDFYGAKEDFEKALKLDPGFFDARYSLAVTKNDLKDYKGALEDLNKPLVLKSAPVVLQIARAYSGLKDYTNALQNYNIAVSLAPHTDTFYSRGVFFMSINYFKQANADFDMAIKFDETNILAYFFRGISSFYLGKYSDALSDFSTSVKFDITDFDAVLGLAFTYYKLNDIENAKLNFTKAKSILIGINQSQINNIALFENTYWYQNQYYSFKELYSNLNEL